MKKPTIKNKPPKPTQALAEGNYTLTGDLEVTADSFTITITGTKSGGTPVPPDPQPPDPDATTITPESDDCTLQVQQAWDNLPDGKTLVLSGQFGISDTLRLSGAKTLRGDPDTPSGIYALRENMSGPYGCILHVRDANNIRLAGFEIDLRNMPVEGVLLEGGSDKTLEDLDIHNIAYPAGRHGQPYACIHSDGGLRTKILRCHTHDTQGHHRVWRGLPGHLAGGRDRRDYRRLPLA